MQKKCALLFNCLLLAAALQLNASEDETPVVKEKTCFEPFSGIVSGSKVRLRVLPNLEAHVVRETTNGELFAVMGETQEYYAVSPPKGTKGYVFRTFILDGSVEGERVNVRLYPDIDAPVVAQLNTGNKVSSTVSNINNKWLEIELPETARFFIAKEYIEKKGPLDLIATLEKKRLEAAHHLSAAALFAQAEMQKPFEQIDLDRIHEKFQQIAREFHDLSPVVDQVHEASALIQDVYVQRKIAFLEGKSEHQSPTVGVEPAQLEKLAKLGINLKPATVEKQVTEIAAAASKTVGLVSTFNDLAITDKMLVWQPLEEALYHLWAASNGEKSIDQFYEEEEQTATILTGIVEPYNRPVKNRPGDFLLRNEHMPVGFLYSTRVNLERLVGQKVTVLAAPRPNHNFAFPAYFVIHVE